MNRQVVLIVIAILAVFGGLVGVVLYQRGAGDDAGVEPAGEDPSAVGEVATGDATLVVDLYFPGGGRLVAERHELAVGEAATERIAAVVEALLAGPRGAALSAPLPEGVGIRQIYLGEGGTAFLDIESVEGAPPPAAGSQREMLTVYSLVNSVVLNFDDIDQLVLLWNGRQLETFGGHLDTMRPLVANPDLIAAPTE